VPLSFLVPGRPGPTVWPLPRTGSHCPARVVPRTTLSARPEWFRDSEELSGPAQSCGNRQLAFPAGCQQRSESAREMLLHCCTLPANRSQGCMQLFNSHSAGSAGAASATPDGPLSAQASCPPSLSCPVWARAGRIAARRVTPASCARPTRRSDKEVCRPPSLIRLGWPGRAPLCPTGPTRPTEPLRRGVLPCRSDPACSQPSGPSPPEGSR
jgi:hypothetical protein